MIAAASNSFRMTPNTKAVLTPNRMIQVTASNRLNNCHRSAVVMSPYPKAVHVRSEHYRLRTMG